MNSSVLGRSCCPNILCPNVEHVEPGTNCPVCGEKSRAFHFLQVDDLQRQKRKQASLKERLVFTPEDDIDSLILKLDAVLKEVAQLQPGLTHGKVDVDVQTMILLLRAQVIQNEISLRVQTRLAQGLSRLLGLG